jgi:hypothetical protein
MRDWASRSGKDDDDPLAKEQAPPFGKPEDPPGPSAWRRLLDWYLKAPPRKSTAARRIRIVMFALAIVHAVVGLPLLWVGLLTSAPGESAIWSPAIGLSLLALSFFLIGCMTWMADT